jgi:hypothetical protein
LLIEGFRPGSDGYKDVEAILEDRFKRRFNMHCMYPGYIFKKYPQLAWELEKRRHPKAY